MVNQEGVYPIPPRPTCRNKRPTNDALSDELLVGAQRRVDVGDKSLRSVEDRGGLAGYQNRRISKREKKKARDNAAS